MSPEDETRTLRAARLQSMHQAIHSFRRVVQLLRQTASAPTISVREIRMRSAWTLQCSLYLTVRRHPTTFLLATGLIRRGLPLSRPPANANMILRLRLIIHSTGAT